MGKNGIYNAPSQFVALFIFMAHIAHDAEHIESTNKTVEKVFNQLTK
jgi:glutamate-1-semialdehyde aminotransferase